MPTCLGFVRATFAGIGLLLACAAGLKLYGLNVSLFAQYGWLTAPRVQMVLGEWEVILALWLLSGRYPRGACGAALATFAAFTAVSLYLGVVGRATCGCFGVVEVSPWYAAALDVVVTALLLTCGITLLRAPADDCPGPGPEGGRAALAMVAVALAVVGVASWAMVAVYGSMGAALAVFQGQPLTHTQVLDLGEGKPGKLLEGRVVVQNWSGAGVRVVGGTTDCTCATTAALPDTVPPGGELSIPVLFRVPPGESGLLTRRVELWTDHESQRVLPLHVHCRVRRP